jgi:predicted ATPase
MLIKRLTLKKILSFNDSTIELGALNVLIGPNAVGKSNLIEAISLLQAAPTGIEGQILRGGGVRQWLWLGDLNPTGIAEIQCELTLPHFDPLSYRVEFLADDGGFAILNEHLKSECSQAGSDWRKGGGADGTERVRTGTVHNPAGRDAYHRSRQPVQTD